MKIGVIAEDDSDVVVIKELTLSLIRPRKIGFKRFVGKGCGKLRKKCRAWADNLARQGCPWIVVVHDLDQYNETELRAQLNSAIADVRASAILILIPRREIESWLLYDSNAIACAFNERLKPRLPHDPEMLTDPKSYLKNLVYREYDKEYLNTRHNELIAKNINIQRLQRSKSFSPHPPFVAKIHA